MNYITNIKSHHFENVAITGTIIPYSTGPNASNCNLNVSSSKLADYRVTASAPNKRWDIITCPGIQEANSNRKPSHGNLKISPSSDQLDACFSETEFMYSVFRLERWQKKY